MKRHILITTIIIFIIGIGFGLQTLDQNKEKGFFSTTENKGMKLISKQWDNNGKLPSKYTCDGPNVSPELFISDVNPDAKSFALIVQDPDAPMGTFVHWIMYNIPATTTHIQENIKPVQKLEDGSIQGVNDFGKIGYGGACPPLGSHRYIFTLYALDIKFDAPANTPQLKSAIHNHTIDKAVLMGTYSRKSTSNGKGHNAN